MKIPKKKVRTALRKLNAARETLDKVNKDIFVRECAHEDICRIGDWIVEVEGILQKGAK